MSTIRLSGRLSEVASCITEGASVVDVGSDHGRLPVWLIQNAKASNVIAADISRDPLSKAMALAKHCNVYEKITFVLGDGLSGISPETVDTIVIAGMGGETISGILNAAEWTKKGDHLLILQPMSATHDLRKYLYDSGYRIEAEKLIRENGRIFNIITARGGRSGHEYEPWEMYVSKELLNSSSPLLEEYLALMKKRLKKAFLGAESSSKRIDRERTIFFEKALKGLMEHADNKRDI